MRGPHVRLGVTAPCSHYMNRFSIITQLIMEIRALPLAENDVIFRYNHLRGGDYSGRTNFLQGRLAFCLKRKLI